MSWRWAEGDRLWLDQHLWKVWFGQGQLEWRSGHLHSSPETLCSPFSPVVAHTPCSLQLIDYYYSERLYLLKCLQFLAISGAHTQACPESNEFAVGCSSCCSVPSPAASGQGPQRVVVFPPN